MSTTYDPPHNATAPTSPREPSDPNHPHKQNSVSPPPHDDSHVNSQQLDSQHSTSDHAEPTQLEVPSDNKSPSQVICDRLQPRSIRTPPCSVSTMVDSP